MERPADKSPIVDGVQRALVDIGLLRPCAETIFCRIREKTEAAIREFQASIGHEPNGDWDEETLMAVAKAQDVALARKVDVRGNDSPEQAQAD